LGKQKIDVLVVGENIEAADVAASPAAIREWVNSGGQALVLRQKKIGEWMPVPLTPKDDVYGFETFLYAVGNPLVNGLLPEDFWRWGNAIWVNGMAYEPPRAGTVRVLAGQTARRRHADGSSLRQRSVSSSTHSNSPLTKWRRNRGGGRACLANILRDAKNSAQNAPANPSSPPLPTRNDTDAKAGGKTLVLSGRPAGERTESPLD
jgi:hypothetical protein